MRNTYREFFKERNAYLDDKYPGLYRAKVVDTNDPLSMGRIRVKIPELHKADLEPELCPWAERADFLGGKTSGSWTSATIGDTVWIQFEKQHPYNPIWVGFCDATRRRYYATNELSVRVPSYIDSEGNVQDPPEDDSPEDYLPKDGRPQGFGFKDRYGNFIWDSSVGFVPSEHKAAPTPLGSDPLPKSKDFEQLEEAKANDPDVKFITIGTKYGHMITFSDIGYDWESEFDGSFDKDVEFESKRTKYLLEQLSEQAPKDRDQRRIELRTRYGHAIEMRDVGWRSSRPDEYDSQNTVSKDSDRDERWVKLRSKGGHLIQIIDSGFDEAQDNFIKRLNKSEFGTNINGEDDLGKDARMIRIQTRYGFQMAFDDRGSDPKNADGNENPRGSGWMVKGRRDNRGFAMGFCEKDEMNTFFIHTPKGKGFEMNDRLNYVGLSSNMSKPLSRQRETKYGIYFPTETMLGQDYEINTNHLKLDGANKYVRMKTAAGQGIEFRDEGGPCGSWAEIKDKDNRGTWINSDDQYMAIRGKTDQVVKKSDRSIVIDDDKQNIIIREKEGKIQIITDKKDIEFISGGNICFKAQGITTFKSRRGLAVEASGTTFAVDGSGIGTNKTVAGQVILGRLPGARPGSGAQSPVPKGAQTLNPQPEDERDHTPDEENCGAEIPKPEPSMKDVFDNLVESPGGDFVDLSAEPFGNVISVSTDDPRPAIGEPYVSPEDAAAYAEAVREQQERCNPRACAPNKGEAGPIPSINLGGGGNGGGGFPLFGPSADNIPPESPNAPTTIRSAVPPGIPEIEEIDPILGSGVLYYGTTDKFLEQIEEDGIPIDSLINNVNTPEDAPSDRIVMTAELSEAFGEGFGELAQQRYGGRIVILRIRGVDDLSLLTRIEKSNLVEYPASIGSEFVEVIGVDSTEFDGIPEFNI